MARYPEVVESLRQQTTPPCEVIIVVDHNPDLMQRVQTHIPDVIAIENQNPRGLSGARNSGLAIAKGQLIAFLDDDAAAEPDWLERLVRCCENPQVLGAGGTVEPLWLSKQPKWFPEEFYWVVGCTYQKRPDRPIVVRNPYGGCSCIRREVFETVGGFRSTIGRIGKLPVGCEETELCIRAQQHWPDRFFLYEPEARIHHHIPAVRGKWSYFRSRCYAEGLSKAAVTRYVGAQGGLAAERSYTLHTLPRGVWKGLMDTLRGDISGCQRAGAIIAGLFITTTGYVVGTISQRIASGKKAPAPGEEDQMDSPPSLEKAKVV